MIIIDLKTQFWVLLLRPRAKLACFDKNRSAGDCSRRTEREELEGSPIRLTPVAAIVAKWQRLDRLGMPFDWCLRPAAR
jgi:hypothetical protein